MSVAQAVQNTIEAMPAGKIFGYKELPEYASAPSAVIKAVNRMVSDKHLERFAKGKFYIAKMGLLGKRKPSDNELIRSFLYKEGRVRGYSTGLSLYNRLGLTTQIPRTITVAYNGGRQEKDFGTIRIKTVVTRIPIREDDIILLQYLDVLKDIKIIPDADINVSLGIIKKRLSALSESELSRAITLAEKYYGPQVRALLGMLYSSLALSISEILFLSLNPTTVYKLNLDSNKWPQARTWNIR
jgi:hypothetical protein